ncbi:dienelactone hydrolase family protein [uncultured Nocardioides sp.]|uniref:dienelactone hydrolase family protein n=1 Tax=uncultured Nocardioides sp. TaxID=198441 RepID=UPI002635A1E0|nr:dienelactone hydrolase family protein [uncultured Nocardioides sp.]
MTSTPSVSVATDAGDMPAHLWLPPAGTGPGVLLLQEIFGISRYVEQRARDLADLGYVVLAPEIFWRLGVRSVPEGPTALDDAMAIAGRCDWDAAVADAVAALGVLRSRPDTVGRTGVVGFCFGGGLGFSVAAHADVDALVAYYGSALPGLLDLAPRVSAPSLHHFGTADSFIPLEQVAQIEAAVVRDGAELVTYAGADHAFDNPDLPFHDADASVKAWARTTAFLADRLPVPAA